MTHTQNKTRLVTGGLANPIGSVILANDDEIIDQLYLQGKRYLPVIVGYNSTSLKTWLYPAQLGGFVLPSNNGAMRAHMCSCTRTTLGVWAIGNDPADHVGESTPTLTGGFQSQNRGGHHA